MKFHVSNQTSLNKVIEYIRNLKLIGREYDIEVKKWIKKRSLSQNTLMWVWFTFLENHSEAGYTKDEWHDVFLDQFPVFEEKIIVDEVRLIRISTSRFNSKQLSTFLEQIRLFIIDYYNIYLYYPIDKEFPEFFRVYNQKNENVF